MLKGQLLEEVTGKVASSKLHSNSKDFFEQKYESIHKKKKKEVEDTAGKDWFNMPATPITPELKQDLTALKLRAFYDPKRFYKKDSGKALPKYFQIGTVVEGAGEFYSSRLTNKERKGRLVDELLTDEKVKNYTKRKFREIDEKKRSGGKGHYKKKISKRKPAWAKQ
eukprot:GILI01007504.1.p1 GENE.GILI01007504.1~~GILI01007504.1.p1  ORF type:complete len:167 (+),score=58.80 GILI01007504.1:107-607(+)